MSFPISDRACSVVEADCECPPGGRFADDVLPVVCYGCGDDVCKACSAIIAYRKKRVRMCLHCQDQRKVGRAAPAVLSTEGRRGLELVDRPDGARRRASKRSP